MTIYAIVNNILSEFDRPDHYNPVWSIISQSCILQGGNPYFVPDFANHFEARIALAVKIGKLGKGIAPRFAHRYVEAAAPSIIFIASDLLKNLREHGLPWTAAMSYDRSLAIGKFSPASIEDCNASEIKLKLESSASSKETKWSAGVIRPKIEDTLAIISRDNTLKTGDIILFGISSEGPEVDSDLRASLSLNDTNTYKFNIR